jgi:hypothetical protein
MPHRDLYWVRSSFAYLFRANAAALEKDQGAIPAHAIESTKWSEIQTENVNRARANAYKGST